MVHAGRMSIILETDVGVERYRGQQMHEFIAIPNMIGSSDFLVTVTCKQRELEIKRMLLPRHSLKDRRYPADRVFARKMKQRMS